MRGKFTTLGAVTGTAGLAIVVGAVAVIVTGAASSKPTPPAGTAGGTTATAPTGAAGQSPAAASSSVASTAAIAAPKSTNGEAAKSGTTVIADAIAAIESKKSFQLDIKATDNNMPAELTLVVVRGTGETATIVQGQSRLQLIVIGQVVYVAGNVAALGNNARAVGGRYVRLSVGTTDGKKLLALIDLRSLIGMFLDPTSGALKVTTGTADGRSVVIVTDHKGSRFYVSGSGPPLPLLATGTPSTPGTAIFSNYGGAFTVKAPPAGQIYSR